MTQSDQLGSPGTEERRQTVRMLSRIIFVSLVAYLVVMISGLFWDDWRVIIVTLISGVFLAIPFWLLRRGHLNASGFLIVMILLVNVTLLATIGQGIHDVAIIAYPIIILFASLAMNRLCFSMSVLLTLASMFWLIVGESSGIFVAKPFETPSWIDFMVITMLISVSALAVDLLSTSIRRNLVRAQVEIAQRIQAEDVLREKEVQYHNLADSGVALIWTSGTDTLFNYLNVPWLKFTGRTLEQEIGNGWLEGIHPEDVKRCLETYITAFNKREKFHMEYRLRHSSNEYRWIADMGIPNYSSSHEFIGYIGHCFDITDRKHLDELLRYQSTHDTLTGVYNRNFFEEEQARLESGREFPISIIIADVNGLKTVNDTKGHIAGDELLRLTANVLRSVFRVEDILARIGGDEFAALLTATDESTAEQIVARVFERLSEHNTMHPEFPVQLSLGSATSDKNNLIGTFALADQRMYANKAALKSA